MPRTVEEAPPIHLKIVSGNKCINLQHANVAESVNTQYITIMVIPF